MEGGIVLSIEDSMYFFVKFLYFFFSNSVSTVILSYIFTHLLKEMQ